MRSLIRSPLTWAVLAEMIVVGALVVLTWNVVGSAAHPGVALPAVAAPDTAADGAEPPLPDMPTVTGDGARGPLPGLNVTSGFWRRELSELNRDEAAFAGLEWRIVHAGLGAARDYVESVVLPAIRRAEGRA